MSTPSYIDPTTLTNCTVHTCPVDSSFYNYRISLPPNAIFLTFFSLSLFLYLSIWLTKRRGTFFSSAMLLGITAEIIGYIGRILSYTNQWNENGFLIQTICLTIAPAFFSAGIYVCLAQIVAVYGAENSLIPPRYFARIFIPCDIAAIILQAAGGATSAIALQSNSSLAVGDDVIIAGLALQVYTLFHFILLSMYFAFRVRCRKVRIKTSRRFRGFIWALGIATIAVFWRSVYRVAELNQGWNGPLTHNQWLFVGFEGVLMVIAVAALGVFHPVSCLDGAWGGVKGAQGDERSNGGIEEVRKEGSEMKAEGERRSEPQIPELGMRAEEITPAGD
ncbi:putative sphingoid long-chain base transporter RSB1 [Mollisia scopiformis]|uniref:Putative sphingoid long-chain base transporter RSB1 n=1 Tax=Mollisia scopiformis TaxID=149040 RepID=A0A194WW42_MOLSC|nr:putative sphingoid long-chain base transporter RSB1 [Mollisia scopiformis]KUJ12186.1 putative sphingoid long-chain base transporter RSB1 [Mollisia scopiformis]